MAAPVFIVDGSPALVSVNWSPWIGCHIGGEVPLPPRDSKACAESEGHERHHSVGLVGLPLKRISKYRPA